MTTSSFYHTFVCFILSEYPSIHFLILFRSIRKMFLVYQFISNNISSTILFAIDNVKNSMSVTQKRDENFILLCHKNINRNFSYIRKIPHRKKNSLTRLLKTLHSLVLPTPRNSKYSLSITVCKCPDTDSESIPPSIEKFHINP